MSIKKQIKNMYIHYEHLGCLSERGCENATVYRIEMMNEFDNLSKQEQEVIYWHLIKNESQEYVAERLGISQGSVSRIVKGAVKKIEQLWGDKYFFRE